MTIARELAPYVAVAVTLGGCTLGVHLGWFEAEPLYQIAAVVAYINSIVNESKVRHLRRALDRVNKRSRRPGMNFR